MTSLPTEPLFQLPFAGPVYVRHFVFGLFGLSTSYAGVRAFGWLGAEWSRKRSLGIMMSFTVAFLWVIGV